MRSIPTMPSVDNVLPDKGINDCEFLVEPRENIGLINPAHHLLYLGTPSSEKNLKCSLFRLEGHEWFVPSDFRILFYGQKKLFAGAWSCHNLWSGMAADFLLTLILKRKHLVQPPIFDILWQAYKAHCIQVNFLPIKQYLFYYGVNPEFYLQLSKP